MNGAPSERYIERDVRGGLVVKLSAHDVAEAQRLLSILAGHETNSGQVSLESPVNSASTAKTVELRQRAREILVNRRRRSEIFGRAMFSEPAWEMLLMLYVLEGEARQRVSRLAEIAEISKSTALRWIDFLSGQGLIVRESHPNDKRAAYVELTEKGHCAIEMYLNETIPPRD